MKKIFLYIIIPLIILELLCRCFLFYHKLNVEYQINAKYYGFSGNFFQYAKTYLRFMKKEPKVIVDDNFNRKFYIPNLNIKTGLMRSFKSNTFGLWDKNFDLQKNKNTYRIICFGSSYTRGIGEKSLPAILEEKLNKRFKDRKFEVINASVSGGSILNGFMGFALNWRLLNPDMIIIDNLFDDVESEIPFYLDNYKKMLPEKDNFWGNLKKHAGIIALFDLFQEKFYLKYDKPTKEALDYYKTILGSFILLGKGAGYEVVTLSCAIAVDKDHNFDENNPMLKTLKLRFFSEFTKEGIVESIQEYNSAMKETALGNKAVFLDMSNAIPKDDQHYVDASHRSEKGNELFAEILLKKLIENKLF